MLSRSVLPLNQKISKLQIKFFAMKSNQSFNDDKETLFFTSIISKLNRVISSYQNQSIITQPPWCQKMPGQLSLIGILLTYISRQTLPFTTDRQIVFTDQNR